MLEPHLWQVVRWFSQEAKVDSGDTAWLLASAALVLLMTPGLAFFYGGLVGRKNVLSTIMHSFITICLVSVVWVLWGYSLAFGPDKGGLIGGLDWAFLRGVSHKDPNPDYGPTVPHQAYMVFQLMFAIITPALITGAFAERMKFKAFLLFIVLWSSLVYSPLAHWVWGVGGWLRNLGALDFAGGTVVHINSGVAALAAALLIGRRMGYGREPKEPHNIPFVVLGAALLWFGWFGFNAGSAVAAGGLATSAFVATNTATAMAALSWMTLAWWMGGSPTAVGAASGAIAGLVAITPASGPLGGGRRPGRVGGPRYRRHLGRPGHGHLRLHLHQRGRGQRPPLRQPGPTGGAGHGRPGLLGLLLPHHPPYPLGPG